MSWNKTFCRRAWRVCCLMAVLAMPNFAAMAAPRLAADLMAQLLHPWPPSGWSEVLDLSPLENSQPYRSQAVLRPGYFGQAVYRRLAGSTHYWTANILVQDRGSAKAAWHAVSSVGCASRHYLGYRARECRRGNKQTGIRTLHYQVDRFYITIQLSGPGEISYPVFSLGAANSSPR
jgi:hypothetical protein